MLRLSRDGGILTAVRYPALDTTIWRSASRVPPLTEVIAFGAEDGYLAAIDTGAVRSASTCAWGRSPRRVPTPYGLVSADGGAIYGLTRSGEVTRYTPSGSDWRYRPIHPVDALFRNPMGR